MASYYSIIQYVPNPIANERINIGVLIFDEKEIKVKFLKNWNRVKNFCMGDITFLRDFESQMQKAVSQGLLFPGDPLLDQPRQERLQRVSENWMNSIQFTEPNFSLKSVDKLLEDSIKKYLIEPVASKSLDKLPGVPKPNIRGGVYTLEGMRSVIGSDAQNDLLTQALEKVDSFKHNS
jgi:hypothetical protein